MAIQKRMVSCYFTSRSSMLVSSGRISLPWMDIMKDQNKRTFATVLSLVCAGGLISSYFLGTEVTKFLLGLMAVIGVVWALLYFALKHRDIKPMPFDFYTWIAKMSKETQLVIQGFHDYKGTRVVIYGEVGDREQEIINREIQWAAERGVEVAIEVEP